MRWVENNTKNVYTCSFCTQTPTVKINLTENPIYHQGIIQSETKAPTPHWGTSNFIQLAINFYSDKLDCTKHTTLPHTWRIHLGRGFEQRLDLRTNKRIDILWCKLLKSVLELCKNKCYWQRLNIISPEGNLYFLHTMMHLQYNNLNLQFIWRCCTDFVSRVVLAVK